MRRKEGFPDNVEFKFNKSKRRKILERKFFEAVKIFDFKIRYLIVDKRKKVFGVF